MRVVLNSFPFVFPLLLHLKMMITVMEGWPTETIFFSSVFPLFFLIFIYVLSCLREE
jgi:hypothetical protein